MSDLAPVFNACPKPLEDQSQAYTPRSIIDLIAELHFGAASIREIEAKTSIVEVNHSQSPAPEETLGKVIKA